MIHLNTVGEFICNKTQKDKRQKEIEKDESEEERREHQPMTA